MLRYLLTVAHGNLVYPFGNVFIDLKHTSIPKLKVDRGRYVQDYKCRTYRF